VSTPTVHSARLNADLFLGKNAPSPPPANSVAMGDLMSAIPAGTLPPIPAHFGTATDFTNDDSANPAAGSWAIGGNGPDNTVAPGFQGCGDCDWISTAHVLMQAAKNAGRSVPPFTGLTVVDQYAAYSGYDLKTGANDNGTDMSDSIKWCQEKGFYDDNGTVYQFGQAVTIEPGNIEQLWAATYLFEAVKIGVEVTTAQMDQFDASANPTWDYVAGSPQEGGHSIPTMGSLGLITWGCRVRYTQRFVTRQMDEGHCFLLPERYSAVTGDTLEGYADADLERFITLLAAQKQAA
jgi:hypothetical protein